MRNLKHVAERRVSGVSSSHLSEAVAAALGFNSHAALRSALKGRKTVQVDKPNNWRLVERLRQLGCTVSPDYLHVLPEFQKSNLLFRESPLNKRRSSRWTAWRNLMVAAVNAGLEQRLFGLCPGDNWWPGAGPESHNSSEGTHHFTLSGYLSVAVSVDVISGDELSLKVLVNPRKGAIPSAFADLREGDAVASGWLERRLGVWIQDGGGGFHCKRPLVFALVGLDIKPRGYSDQGPFFL